jgi:uncharacterized protein involved in tellurium resistance
MERRKWLAIKNNYVVAAFIWDGVAQYTYPDPECTIVEDVEQKIGIGMWYEEAEDVFYMPISKPNDVNYPEELNYLWETNEIIE